MDCYSLNQWRLNIINEYFFKFKEKTNRTAKARTKKEKSSKVDILEGKYIGITCLLLERNYSTDQSISPFYLIIKTAFWLSQESQIVIAKKYPPEKHNWQNSSG